MAERETHSLIGSDKVDGTAVYGADQQKIGSVERVMIDKLSGKVAYAASAMAASWEWAKSCTQPRGPTSSMTPISVAIL